MVRARRRRRRALRVYYSLKRAKAALTAHISPNPNIVLHLYFRKERRLAGWAGQERERNVM